jgi:hypothetical protein
MRCLNLYQVNRGDIYRGIGYSVAALVSLVGIATLALYPTRGSHSFLTHLYTGSEAQAVANGIGAVILVAGASIGMATLYCFRQNPKSPMPPKNEVNPKGPVVFMPLPQPVVPLTLKLLPALPTAIPSKEPHLHQTESKTELKLSDQENDIIENVVGEFLQPYTKGQIREEDNLPKRVPLIELIYKAIGPLSEEKKKLVQRVALCRFFFEAAYGLYSHPATKPESLVQTIDGERKIMIFAQNSPAFDALFNGLKGALPKEFPSLVLSEKEILKRARKALAEANAKIMEIVKCLRS